MWKKVEEEEEAFKFHRQCSRRVTLSPAMDVKHCEVYEVIFRSQGCNDRLELLLSSNSPSLDGSAQLSIVATDEFSFVTKLSLPLTRAPVEQVKEEYVGDLVTLLQVMRDSTVSSSFGSCGRAGNSTCIVMIGGRVPPRTLQRDQFAWVLTSPQEGEAQPLRGNPEAGAQVQAWTFN
ncbi:uncharacterized protein LOC144079447 [Stigmatopora argus]